MQYDVFGALKRYFGFDDFLDNQQEVVEKVVAGRDLCVIMPTGAGKSLCYQLPILMRPGYGIVVSPLISLMKDQVDSLMERGISAAFINSTVAFAEQCRVIDAVAAGEVKLLYVAPERFQMEFFRNFLTRTPPELVIIDEAHCISQWGHDFRPSYWRLGEVMDEFAVSQVCAFTATATAHVREDIRTQLHRPQMELMVAGFKRPNLSFSVVECSSDASKFAAIRKLLDKSCPTIIYTSTRKAVEQLVAEFGIIGYHAGMSDQERKEVQDRFMAEPCPVLAATNAFGMGIDRPDVRQVIHYNLPGSLEAYYQEAGRAGRDGEAADCILLYAYRDKFVQEFLIDLSNPPPSLVQSLYTELLRLGRSGNTDTLELTLGDLVPQVEGARNDAQLSAAMAQLEQAGLVSRGGRQSGGGTLCFTGDLRELQIEHQLESTQRSRFISRCIRHYGARLSSELSCSVGELGEVAGLNPEQVRRVLHALDGVCLTWKVSFAGRSTQLLHPEVSKVDLDFSAMTAKREFEMARLEEVVGYARCSSCRQAYLISYFGEVVDGWSCGSCDGCRDTGLRPRRAPNASELEAVRTILAAADSFDGRIGAGKLSQVLAGSKSAESTGYGFQHSPFFGALQDWRQNRILVLMKALERDRCLGRVERGQFPCLELTPRGLEVLNGRTEPMIDCAEEQVATPRVRHRTRAASIAAPVVSPEAERLPLWDLLRELRKEVAKQRGVPVYQVLTNATLEAMAEQQPLTVEEAMRLPGIGERKAVTVVPIFLEAIRRHRRQEREGNLLN